MKSLCPTFLILMGLASWVGCDDGAAPVDDLQTSPRYAETVVEYSPGVAAGFGQESLPQIVLGAPDGKGPFAGGTDVLSLGVGGEIVLGFGDVALVDGPGSDFRVFENAFYGGGDPTNVFAELAEISVSQDGTTWDTFPCDPTSIGPQWPGCAGYTPTLPCDDDPQTEVTDDCGGDAFDLADIGVTGAKFIRIRDLSGEGLPPTAGFDLDAVVLLNWRLGVDP